MKISFNKLYGDPSLDVRFFWKMTVDAKSPVTVTDHIIPELFFDYLFVKAGMIRCNDKAWGRNFTLPRQSLKTIYTRPLTFIFSTPIVLYGVRLTLKFAESYWGGMNANSFLKQTWVEEDVRDLDSFKNQIEALLTSRRMKKSLHPMVSSGLDESAWLINFSPRHKRRLYRALFGLSRKELLNVRNVQSFLEQTCDFASENPRIIRHVDPEVFYDQPHLNHTFKKITGFSPVEYFEANSFLQDNLMAASYNEDSVAG